MNSRVLACVFIACLSLLFSGCASTPAQQTLTPEECGPFPENFATLAEDYGQTTRVLSAQADGAPFRTIVTPSRPQPSKDRLHPGWLVRADRKLLLTSKEKTSQFSVPFQILIYNGKIVWSSDEKFLREGRLEFR
jgi:hypothetical protein